MKNIRIDFVSDVACPWCAIGLGSLEQALDQLKNEIQVELQFHPFELNPNMPKGGQDTMEHLMHKYGSSRETIQKNQEQILIRAAAAGFPFNDKVRPKVYNTFDCHRLLHWAMAEVSLAAQYLLKRELLISYFRLLEDLDDPEVLLGAVKRAGINVQEAKKVLESNQYTDEVREALAYYKAIGITAVPSIIFEGKYLVQGGQPAEVFVDTIRQIANESVADQKDDDSI
jgi:predicted DsbA family dithiol-disulfide isomerase